MLLIEEARAAYLSAARIYGHLFACRTDLLADALAGRVGGPTLQLSGGYRDVGGDMSVCLPAEARATMARLPRVAEGEAGSDGAVPVEIVTSDMDWMTLEGWLPGETSRRCIVELEIVTDAPVVADVLLRCIGQDGSIKDQTPVEWRLVPRQLQLLELAGSDCGPGRCKVVIQLRRPPERLVVRHFVVTALD